MNEGLISKRYAKALYEHAADIGEEELLYHRMQILETVWRKMPDLQSSLRSPLVPVEVKIGLLKNATGKNAEQSYLDFVNLIVANHRLDALFMITLSYQHIYRQKKHISVVHLISATRLPHKAVERIRLLTEYQTHSKVEFSDQIDSSLVGGFIFHLNDIRIDASVRGQLESINRRLASINKSIM